MQTKVVNRKTEEFDVYIGRGSIFGNPFSHLPSSVPGTVIVGSREEAIAKYRNWFYEKIKDPKFLAEVEKLRGKRLGCYCKPLECHGDVIKEFLDMQTHKPYLCGPILGCTDSECKNWREEAKKRYPEAIDPMVRDYRGKEDTHVKEIVEIDKQDVDNSTVVLVNYVKPSVGTSMEILYAYEQDIPVVTVAAPGTVLSPWLKYHSSRILDSFVKAYDFIDGLPVRKTRNNVKVINSDIFNANVDAIIHQANCQCTMGSGIAAALRARWPKVYEADCKTKKGDENKLGKISVAEVEDPSVKVVFNLYGQFYFGRDKRYTDYEAVARGLEEIKDYLREFYPSIRKIGIPYKMSCNLAGGNWRIVQTIIEEAFKDSEFEILICKKD